VTFQCQLAHWAGKALLYSHLHPLANQHPANLKVNSAHLLPATHTPVPMQVSSDVHHGPG
jgi:hypothetical protein